MKDELIRNIINSMTNHLNQEQLEELKRTLDVEMYLYKVEKEETALSTVCEDENIMIVKNFLIAKKIEGCSDQTLTFYKQTVIRMLQFINKNIRDITTNDLRYYFGTYQVQKNVSKVTINNNRRNLNSFFTWLENEDYIVKSPIRRIHKVKQDKLIKKAFSEEEIEKLRDACKDIRETALIDILLSTGMRIGELEGLKRNDIDIRDGKLIVFGKGAKEREVYLNAKAKIHIAEYLLGRADNSPWLFVANKAPYNGLKKSGFSYILKSIAKRANVTNVHPHRFRRTAATIGLNRGMPIEQVQLLLGHTSINTTLKYAIVNERNVRLSHEKYLS